MAQFAVPDADTATGSGWSNSGFARLDEGAPGDDVTAAQASNNDSEFLDKGLTDVTDPEVSTGHTLRARWRKSSGNRTTNGFLELWQGVPGSGTLIATLTENDIPTALAIVTYGLTGTEIDNITDYDAIQLRQYYTYTGGGSPGALELDFIELETPDAPSGAVTITLVIASAASSAVALVVNRTAAAVVMAVASAASSAHALVVNRAGAVVTLLIAAAASSAQALPVTRAPATVTLVQSAAAASAQPFPVSVARLIELTPSSAASSAQVFPVSIGTVSVTITLQTAQAAATAQVFTVAIVGVGAAVRLVRRIGLSRRPTL